MDFVDCMLADRSRVWNSVQVEESCASHGGEVLINRLSENRTSSTHPLRSWCSKYPYFQQPTLKNAKLAVNNEDYID